MAGLISIGIPEDEAEELWSAQHNKKRAFGKFLKDIESQRAKADIIQDSHIGKERSRPGRYDSRPNIDRIG